MPHFDPFSVGGARRATAGLRGRALAFALAAGIGSAGVAGAGPSPPVSPASASSPPASAPRTEAPKPDAAPPSRFIAIDDVRPGMKGYGLTVFEGTRPERFPVRVIGVLRKFLPQQDIILIECDDPRLRHSGIVAGMSGSPIYFELPDGPRLAGALAYGWHFAKDPIAGVTPIENMVAELRRPLRGRESTPFAEAALTPPPPRPETPRLASVDGLDPAGLRPVALPLAVSGFAPSAFAELKRLLEPWGISAMAAGGGAPPPGAAALSPGKFEPGGAIAVQLIRGDMSAAGTGTVTYVEGERVAAFGHPMFNLGEVYVPIATAEVHTVLASLSSSFKIASPLVEMGTLLQDRQSCIVGETASRADMIPMTLKVGAPGQPGRTFQVEVLRHRFLTPLLAASVVGNAVQAAASDLSDATITVRTAIGLRGHKPLELTDHAFSADGFSPRTMMGLLGMKAIGDILFNPFAPASLERVDVSIELDYRADVAEITGIQLGADALQAGTRPTLRVTLRPYNGVEYTESVPIEIPRALAGQLVKIEAAAGNLARPTVAAPERFEQLLDNLTRAYTARSIVLTLQAPDDGLALRGAVLSDLPGSVIDALRPGASSRRGETFKESTRIVVPARSVVVGKQEIQVKIKDEPSR